MKSYGALQIIAFILKLIGWFTIALAVLVLIAGLTGANPMSGVPTVSVLTALATVISGIVVLATGESIQALVDIAVNSAKIESHTARTVEFFERMDGSRLVEPRLP